jgi:hypothetical protein
MACGTWSDGALQNIKFQEPNLRVLGVRCRVSGRRNIKAVTLTLNPETSIRPEY